MGRTKRYFNGAALRRARGQVRRQRFVKLVSLYTKVSVSAESVRLHEGGRRPADATVRAYVTLTGLSREQLVGTTW